MKDGVMTDTRDEVVARMREFMKTSHSETEYRLLLKEGLNLLDTLSRQLAEAQEEVRKLRERLGPLGLEVVIINGAGHYVNKKVAAHIAEARRDIEEWRRGNRAHVAAENVANARLKEAERQLAEAQAERDALREGRDTMGNLWAKAKEELAEARAVLSKIAEPLLLENDGLRETTGFQRALKIITEMQRLAKTALNPATQVACDEGGGAVAAAHPAAVRPSERQYKPCPSCGFPVIVPTAAMETTKLKPHDYSPSIMHQGDCAVCGHTQDAPIHKHPAAMGTTDE